MDSTGRVVSVRSGREWADWSSELRMSGDELRWKFVSDSSVNGWGWRFTVYPIHPAAAPCDVLSDRALQSRPSIDLVRCLLGECLKGYTQRFFVVCGSRGGLLVSALNSVVNGLGSSPFGVHHIYSLTVLNLEATMGDKSVELLGSKIRFSSTLETFPLSPFPQTMLPDLSISFTAQTTAPTQH